MNTVLITVPEGWCVVGNDDKLSLSSTQCLQSLLVTQHIFTTLHHEGQTRVDALKGLFLQSQNQRQNSTCIYTAYFIATAQNQTF